MISVMKMKYNKYLTEEEDINDPLRDYAEGVDCIDLDCSDSVEYDDDHIIKDMRDFKRVMSEHPEVVYGKDKNGYFVICIDQDDFNNLYSIMTEVGYSKDDVFANIMPQILDRSGMISTAN